MRVSQIVMKNENNNLKFLWLDIFKKHEIFISDMQISWKSYAMSKLRFYKTAEKVIFENTDICQPLLFLVGLN